MRERIGEFKKEREGRSRKGMREILKNEGKMDL